jgi:hypothetical protein
MHVSMLGGTRSDYHLTSVVTKTTEILRTSVSIFHFVPSSRSFPFDSSSIPCARFQSYMPLCMLNEYTDDVPSRSFLRTRTRMPTGELASIAEAVRSSRGVRVDSPDVNGGGEVGTACGEEEFLLTRVKLKCAIKWMMNGCERLEKRKTANGCSKK